VRRGDTLGQLRLARGRPSLDAQELALHQRSASPLCRNTDHTPAPVTDEGIPSILLSVDLEGADGQPIGYLARRHLPPVDLQRRGLPVQQYWTPIHPSADGHVLEPEQFYIFATRESLCVPPELCAELVAFDATKGELRTHYAGFIDSGFGWSGPLTRSGARLVLEIRTHDVPFLLEHGQPLFRVEFMRNEARPDVLYGEAGSNYQMQGLKLAKQFG
jgi:dCTP deaminase